VICYEGIYIRDHWRALTALPWWTRQDPDLQAQLAWRRDFLAATPQDWFHLPSCPPLRDRERLSVEAGDDGVFQIDKVTGAREQLVEPQVSGWSPGRKVQSVHAPRLPETFDEIDASIPVDDEFDPDRSLRDGCGDLAGLLLEEFGRRLMPVSHVSSPLWRCYTLWGFEGMMTMIASRTDLVKRACRRLLAQCRHSVRLAAAIGAGAIWIEECLTDMISPDAFAEVNLPYLRALVEEVRACGMKSIYYFCGKIDGKGDLLLSAGADALSLEESKKGFVVEIEDIVDAVGGRCTLLGNLDAIGTLQNGSDAQLRHEVARQIAAGRANGGRFIMSLGSPVTPDTPVDRVRRYCELVHELGG